jgi:hypothetical protein
MLMDIKLGDQERNRQSAKLKTSPILYRYNIIMVMNWSSGLLQRMLNHNYRVWIPLSG